MGVAGVTVHRHFDSEPGLLNPTGEDLAQQAGLVSGVHAAAQAECPVRAFTATVEELCRFWSTDPEVIRRLVSLPAVDPEARQVIATRSGWTWTR